MSTTSASTLADDNSSMLITIPPDLNRPVDLLSDNIQKSSRAFYDVHSLLTQRKCFKALEHMINSKNMIKSEFEAIHQILQSSYRHIIDFTSSCKRAPEDRAVSAHRCQRSGRAILRDLQTATSTFEIMVESFKAQKHTLAAISLADGKEKMKKAASFSKEKWDASASYPLYEDCVSSLYDALDDTCSSLKQFFLFWDGHVSLLTLIVNRQTNYPNLGEETKEAVELWTEYQRIILKANSSISQSIETMAAVPVVTTANLTRPRQMPWRRHTYPQTKLRREPTIVESILKPASQWQEMSGPGSGDLSICGRLSGFIRRLF